MSISAAVEAYRQSAYNNIEHQINTSTGQASMPLVGGAWSRVKSIGNNMARPFKVGSALVFGGNYPVDAQHVPTAQIPADIQNTPYGQALEKTREYGRKSADLNAESVGKLLSGDISGYFRNGRAAAYNHDQQARVILPDEGSNIVDMTAGIGAAVGARYLAHSLLGSMTSVEPSTVGQLASPLAGFDFSSLAIGA